MKGVKGVKEVNEVKAICLMAKKPAENSSIRASGFNFQRPQGAITSFNSITSNSITSELTKVQ